MNILIIKGCTDKANLAYNFPFASVFVGQWCSRTTGVYLRAVVTSLLYTVKNYMRTCLMKSQSTHSMQSQWSMLGPGFLHSYVLQSGMQPIASGELEVSVARGHKLGLNIQHRPLFVHKYVPLK